MAELSRARCEDLANAWPDASSLADAHLKAGLKTKDPRAQLRNRREVEKQLGVTLVAHNPKNSTFWELECPSTLDVPAARKKKDFVVTSYTNDSPLIEPFLKALKKFSDHRQGQLLVVPVRYANPNAMRKGKGLTWPEEIQPYALTKDLNLNRNLRISSHRLQATAARPLSGLEALSGQKSAIYGHPQLCQVSVGTPNNELPKKMMTTGSCNRARYSATNAGGKASFWHTVYALYVKVVGDKFYHIQLGWDGKGFCYGNEYWTEKGLRKKPCVANIVHGDSHVLHEIAQISASKLRIKELLRPEVQIWHDLHDQGRGGHHETLREKAERMMRGEMCIEEEIRMSISYLERMGKGTDNWIVGSNHNDHLDKWHMNFRPKEDPFNIKFHGWLSSIMYGTKKNALESCFDEWGCKVGYKFLGRGKRAEIKGIDLSQHGDVGVNGARGSLVSFAKTMLKTFVGHSHTDGIEKGAWQVGTSTNDLDYAKGGYSTWSLTDGLIYENGKRALVTHINNKTIFDVA